MGGGPVFFLNYVVRLFDCELPAYKAITTVRIETLVN